MSRLLLRERMASVVPPSLSARPSHAEPPAAVYLLFRTDHARFKVGWAIDPLHRARSLPDHEQLDYARCRVRWFSSQHRARQVEKVVHRALEPYASHASHYEDGYSEWFCERAEVPAMQMLTQVPAGNERERAWGLEPLCPQSGGDDTDPLSRWFAVEDLLLRWSFHLRLQPEGNAKQRCLLLVGFRRWDDALIDLRGRLMDTGTYDVNIGGQRRSLIRLIEYRGEDLALWFTPTRVVEQWPQGRSLVSLIEAFAVRAWQFNR